MDGHTHVGPLHGQYDRRGQQVSGNRAEDNLELPTFIRTERQGESGTDLLGRLLSLGSLAKAIGAGALVILGWSGAKITMGNERTTRLEAYMERSAPVLEFLGRETCANIPATEYPRRAPLCPQLMGAPGYLSRPQADLAPADGSFTSNPMSSVANLGGIR